MNVQSIKTHTFTRDLAIVLGTSLLFALSAWISIPLPFTPVPISFTCQLILLASVLLGKRGAYATLAYLAQGMMGLPVFAGGVGGAVLFFGPTGGYLVGYAVAAVTLGILSEQIKEKTPLKTFSLMLLGNVLIYFFGVTYLATIVGGQSALKWGLYPFVGLDLLKILILNRFCRSAHFGQL